MDTNTAIAMAVLAWFLGVLMGRDMECKQWEADMKRREREESARREAEEAKI